jgi:hypothetical protein
MDDNAASRYGSSQFLVRGPAITEPPNTSEHTPDFQVADTPGDQDGGRAVSMIYAALAATHHATGLSRYWEELFSEPECPVCTVGEFFEPVHSTRLYESPLLQTDSLSPTSIPDSFLNEATFMVVPHHVHSAVIRARVDGVSSAAWIKRCLTKLRYGTSDEDSISVQLDENQVDVLYPLDFHMIRHALGISDTAFRDSVRTAVTVELRGGKSKSAFLGTVDGRYVIKSISAKEEIFLRSFGPALFWYYAKTLFQPIPSVLTPILGVYRVGVKNPKQRCTYVIMERIPTSQAEAVFDLKGVGSRRAAPGIAASPIIAIPRTVDGVSNSEETISEDGTPRPSHSDRREDGYREVATVDVSGDESPRAVLWDQDFRVWSSVNHLQLSQQSHQYLMSALHNDSVFLSSLQVIDYSLLVTITSLDSHGVVQGGIIDYFRQFTWDKKLESVVKSVNQNLSSIGSWSKGMDSPLTAASDVPAFVPAMDKAPTVIKPEAYAHRFRTNVSALFPAGAVPNPSNTITSV